LIGLNRIPATMNTAPCADGSPVLVYIAVPWGVRGCAGGFPPCLVCAPWNRNAPVDVG
jgi:hypothetical protein